MTTDKLDRTIAACIFPGFRGLVAPDWLLRWIEHGLGGVVLFARNVENAEQVGALSAALRSARTDVLIATDEEGGDVTRLEARAGSSYPGNWALGVVDDPPLTEAVAAAIGADLAQVGINFDLAPVADINSNPNNPVIGIRAFGARPALVARHVAAFVRGVQRQGVAACAKHFPGHGDTTGDSHLELPVAEGDAAAALEPFRAAIDAGVQAIMTAHIRVPAIDDQPATLSRPILHSLLREQLGFGGVTITDALEMRALSATLGVEESAVRALAAGADALCLGADVAAALVDRVHAAVRDAVDSAQLDQARIEEAAGRVTELARWASTPRGARPGAEVGLAAARRATRVEGTVDVRGPVVVIELRPQPSIAAGPVQHGLGAALDGAETVELAAPPRDAAALVEGRTPVIVTRDAHRHRWQQDAVSTLVAAAPNAVVVEVGVPVWRPEGAAGYIATHGAGRANLAAAAEALAPDGA
jgi:beta-N-acetylhexosaminidase